MIKIAVLTTTRAEYGLMKQLLFRMNDDPEIKMCLLVTGTHLLPQFGMTVDEIKKDRLPIAAELPIIVENVEGVDTAKTMSRALTVFSDFFAKNRFDFLLVDGDRYETLGICIAAVLNDLPIIHCGGGEVTYGANDDYWRHAITKLSYLHFPIMEKYKNRIIQMGESPERVFNVGSMGLENVRKMELADRAEIAEYVGLSLNKPYALVTFHPVTFEKGDAMEQIDALLNAVNAVEDMQFIFTKANADHEGQLINERIESFAAEHHKRIACVASLGARRYLGAMKCCEFVLGNSSSGIIETPSFGVPTINVGQRQAGREQAASIINCDPTTESILGAIAKARSAEFKNMCKNVVNPNGDGRASERIVKAIKETYQNKNISMKKPFFDF
ncbi:MAG: UDP-N-acetylglucosamine 2-epimerase (hydrolyzing) [Clostridia bacterium]|nr:UDP-N-acetylglucosamine 2-epimerase (hydrolyzing) [Clostridia bacterium]